MRKKAKTKAMRQWRFSSIEDIDEPVIQAYINEAIQHIKDGKEIKPEKKALIIPEELLEACKRNTQLETAFNNFNLTKKREYADYISHAKKEATRMKRLEKIIPLILEGKGLNDKYRR